MKLLKLTSFAALAVSLSAAMIPVEVQAFDTGSLIGGVVGGMIAGSMARPTYNNYYYRRGGARYSRGARVSRVRERLAAPAAPKTVAMDKGADPFAKSGGSTTTVTGAH